MPRAWSRNVLASPFQQPINTDAEAASALWAPYYTYRDLVFGNGATLVNFGDVSNFGATSAATGTGMRFGTTGLAPTWTPVTAMSAWATPFNLANPANWQGIAPALTFDGTNDYATTPDAAYWSRGDGAIDSPFSVGFWINKNASKVQVLLGKWGAANEEWRFDLTAADLLVLRLHDDSQAVTPTRTSDAAIGASGTWQFLVATYAGTGGATAANGIVLYKDGAAIASTAANDVNYVAMENGTLLVQLGYNGNATPGALYNGKIAGGPFCPFFVQAELTASQIKNLYQVERLALGV